MTSFYEDRWLTILEGDCRAVMAEMEPASVHCVVTSPPYWGLRDYGTATWVGGDAECDHTADVPPSISKSSTLAPHRPPMTVTGNQEHAEWSRRQFRDACGKCGAVREDDQIGLEAAPEAYVEHIVEVFRAVHRVLRDDGTVWLNLGDSYASSGGERTYGSSDNGVGRGPGTRRYRHVQGAPDAEVGVHHMGAPALKTKDLVGIPWRVAFALQADGWYLRSDIIWAKPNPMPESVTDRPTKAHEYLFLLSKSPRYYFDADAVREDAIHAGRTVKASDPETAKNAQKGQYGATALGFTQHDTVVGAGRNLRTVWTIATAPYPGAHFATFPPKLVEPCVKAGCPPDGVVLDPFAGSGTTGMVAQSLGRRAVLIDLNGDYLRQQMARASREFGVGGTYVAEREPAPEPPEDSLWAARE